MRSAAGLELRDVSILGGRLQAARIFVPASGADGAEIDGLTVDGNAVSSVPNTLVELGSGNYAMVLQEAVLPGRLRKDVGLVGLRVVLGSRTLLVGLARPPVAAKHRTAPWSLFGLAPLASVGGPARGIGEPIFSSGGPIGDRAVAIAMQYLGVPYVWAGASPFSGFDCSGLTMYVYAQLGIHLTHFAGAQYNEGTRIPVELLEPGDLVFFEPGRLGPGHVGIYIGAGEFIQAPHTGDVVKVSDAEREVRAELCRRGSALRAVALEELERSAPRVGRRVRELFLLAVEEAVRGALVRDHLVLDACRGERLVERGVVLGRDVRVLARLQRQDRRVDLGGALRRARERRCAPRASRRSRPRPRARGLRPRQATSCGRRSRSRR